MKLRPFELGLVIFFGLLFLVSLFLLNNYEAPSCEEEGTCVNLGGSVVIWGTVPEQSFDNFLFELGEKNEEFKNISYTYVPLNEFSDKFLNSLADQTPPDVLLLPHEKLIEYRSRLLAFSYEDFPIRDFENRFVSGASVFALQDGIYAFPVMVDPLVMYWNKDMLSNKGFLFPPSTWEELVNKFVPSLVVRDFNRNIEKSAIAMGDYSNIRNAFPVLSMLLLQSDSYFVKQKSFEYEVNLNLSVDSKNKPLEETLKFYTNFSNTNNSLYQWNRTMNEDKERFLSEDLAFYFGFGSEGKDIEAKNPNLNFDIVEVPQSDKTINKRTYGTFYGFFIPKFAKNRSGAIATINSLTSEQNTKRIADMNNMVPANKSLIIQGSNDFYGRVSYLSAVNAWGWLNPKIENTNKVFSDEINSINNNQQSIDRAAGDINVRLKQYY